MTTTQFSLLQDEVTLLARRSRRVIRDWLCDGLIDYFVHEDSNAFFPHQYVTAFNDPLQQLIETYRLAKPALKSKLREGVLSATTFLRVDGNDSPALTREQRLGMLRVLCILIPATYCFEAASSIVAAITENRAGWLSPKDQEDAFATVLRCVADLAIHGDASTHWTYAARADLESQVVFLTTLDDFQDAYVPICIHALTAVNPESFFLHKDLFGERMARLHLSDPAQLQHAHRTAELIVTKGLSFFRKYADRLSLGDGKDYDAWIFEALMHENSPYTMLRLDRHATTVRLFRKPKTSAPTSTTKPYVYLRSPALVHLRVKVRQHNLKAALHANLGAPSKVPQRHRHMVAQFFQGRASLFGSPSDI